jgi:hypothetical protein
MVPEVKAKKLPAIWGAKSSASALNWSLIDARLLACAVQAVQDADGALTIGTTRDHTAVTLKLWVGKDSVTNYIGTAEKLEEALNELIDAFGSTAEDIRQLFGVTPA